MRRLETVDGMEIPGGNCGDEQGHVQGYWGCGSSRLVMTPRD